jgi:hypothetical protein
MNYATVSVRYTQKFDSSDPLLKCLVWLSQIIGKMLAVVMLSITMITARARDTVNNEYTEEIKVESTVKYQILYLQLIVVVGVMLKLLDLRGYTSICLKQCCVCACGELITTRTKQSLTDTLQKLKNQLIHFGLIVNEPKKLNI